MSVAHSVRMVGDWGSLLEFVSFGWFSFGYISPKSKVLCDPYSLGSDITKKEKRMAAPIDYEYWARRLPAKCLRLLRCEPSRGRRGLRCIMQ